MVEMGFTEEDSRAALLRNHGNVDLALGELFASASPMTSPAGAVVAAEPVLSHCTALCFTALHCTVLHCTALHCTVLYCTVLECTVLH